MLECDLQYYDEVLTSDSLEDIIVNGDGFSFQGYTAADASHQVSFGYTLAKINDCVLFYAQSKNSVQKIFSARGKEDRVMKCCGPAVNALIASGIVMHRYCNWSCHLSLSWLLLLL